MKNKKQIIVMMGGPGVGKGTFSTMLMTQHPYTHIEAGAILRAEPLDSPVGRLISVGDLVPDKLVCNLMQARLTGNTDIILDGFPRTLGQAKWLVENYANKYNIHVLYLYTDTETLIKRIHKRLNAGSTRHDDTSLKIIRHRLENFQNITMPAVDWLRTAPGIHFSAIDANGSVDENYAEITNALNQWHEIP